MHGDLIEQKLISIEHFQGNKMLPMLHLDKKLIDELTIPWEHALVVKLLGKELEFNIMKKELDNLWNLDDRFDLIKFGNDGFYMITLWRDDKIKVINGVPWKIFDHYLSVCQVSSSIDETRVSRLMLSPFDPPKETVKTMVWVRIPNLHPVYYDEKFLRVLASAIGQPVTVDLSHLSGEIEKFARVCVDIELNEVVVSSVGINGKWYSVQYEDSVIICTQCGSYGHYHTSCCASIPSSTNNITAAESEGSHREECCLESCCNNW